MVRNQAEYFRSRNAIPGHRPRQGRPSAWNPVERSGTGYCTPDCTQVQRLWRGQEFRRTTLKGRRALPLFSFGGLPAVPRKTPFTHPWRRGRTKLPGLCWGSVLAKTQSSGRNLALRCQPHREAVLLFLDDEGGLFDNNQAGRDIRPFCIKRKVTRNFRSEEGGQHFARIQSCISMLDKQGLDVRYGPMNVFCGGVILLSSCLAAT